MSSEHSFEFTKENIDLYLKEIAKECRIKTETKKLYHCWSYQIMP